MTYFEALSGGLSHYLPLLLRLRAKTIPQSYRTPGYFVDLTTPAPGTRCPATTTSTGIGSVRDQLLEQLTDGGIPEKLATCIVDGMIKRVGEQKFNDMVLRNDQDGITKLAQAQALQCATSGG